MTLFEEILQTLFFGSGAWLGTLILLLLVFCLALIHKVAKMFLIPISAFIGLWYLQNVSETSNLMWIALMFFLFPIFLVIWVISEDGD